MSQDMAVESEPVEDGMSYARLSLLEYTKAGFPGYKADPFHAHLANEITEFVLHMGEAGRPTRLMIFAPPQHGKSELVSTRLPGFWLGHHPNLPVALVSYAASLAYRNSRLARDVVTSPQYTDIFGPLGIKPDPSNWRVTDWHLMGRKGYIMAAGVGGPITGHGFGLGIIDDPIESWAHAQSEVIRESTHQWYLGTFKTRLWEGAGVILMMTRWHEDDLAGRILASEGIWEEGGMWKVLRYAAMSEGEDIDVLKRPKDDALAPSRFSKEYLIKLREELGEYVWAAEYQQRPTRPQGAFFRVGMIQIVTSVPSEVAEIKLPEPQDPERTAGIEADPEIVAVHKGTRYWDLAASEKKTGKGDPDFTSGTLLSVFGGKVYVLDQVTERLGPEQVQDLIKQTAALDGRHIRLRMSQDPGQAGKAQIADYIRRLMGYDVEGVSESGDKQVRATPLAAQANAGNMMLLKAKWNRKFLERLAGFPHAAHDDEVDSASGAFNDQVGGEKYFRRRKYKVV